MKKLILFSLWAAFLILPKATYATTECGVDVAVNNVKVDLVEQSSREVSPDIFGFDAPFPEFQSGYVLDGIVDKSLIEFLKPFKGAFYRYPGGNYFQWENSVLPLRERKPNATEFLGYLVPEFGLDEYLNFLKMVDGKGIFQLNLLGRPSGHLTREKIAATNLALLKWVNKHPEGARLTHWELGNELDWGSHKLSALDYINVAQSTIDSFSNYPDHRLIVSGKTNPWQYGVLAEEKFNRTVVKAGLFDGISLHAYYDGYPISMMEDTIKRYATAGAPNEKPLRVYITEHGRWPAERAGRKWEESWYQASGSLGALSSADFMLMAISMPQVATAVWHALGVHGPWQLIHIDRKKKKLYPSATYWALRTLREGFLNAIVPVRYDVLDKNKAKQEYAGGYTNRLIAMRDNKNKWSLLGVNRSKNAAMYEISLHNNHEFHSEKIIQTKLDVSGANNTASNPNLIGMEYKIPSQTPSKVFSYCAPPHSVFAVLFARK